MKVFLLKDVTKVGMAGEVVKVKEGFATNFLLPRKLALEITAKNEAHFKKRTKVIDHRKEVITTQTSMLAEKIKNMTINLAKKMHDDGKLYGSVNSSEIVELLAKKGVRVSKNQIEITKSIKEKGLYPITIKLSSRLQPKVTLKVISE